MAEFNEKLCDERHDEIDKQTDKFESALTKITDAIIDARKDISNFMLKLVISGIIALATITVGLLTYIWILFHPAIQATMTAVNP
jgi:uncharacterized membrane protein